MDSEFLTTREVADLLRIKERKVYDMAADQKIPCTRATGKLLFSRSEIKQWLLTHSSGVETTQHKAPLLFAGSHDPLLEWAIRESQCGIPVLFDGSVDGLSRVANRTATVSAMHIYNPDTDDWNINAVNKHAGEATVVLVNWVVRQRGLICSADKAPSRFEDITSRRIVLRQPGAGSQILLEHFLEEASIDIADLDVAVTVRSEADVALAISEGRADFGLGLESLAQQYKLEFRPMLEESFDLLVDRRFWFEPEMQKFIAFCRSDLFVEKISESVGYRADSLFSVVYNR